MRIPRGMRAKNPLFCAKCGKVAQTYFNEERKLWIVGTDLSMRCPDCSGGGDRATMCRECCPTEHGCKLYSEEE